MTALSVIDLAMFLLETPERPFNIGPLVVLDPPARGRKTFADRLMAAMLKRPAGLPFSYKLRTTSIALPTLELDDDADVSAQVHRVTLGAPGTVAHLCETVCKLHEGRLDRSKLLWETYVIDGLEGGKVAVYCKVHHGIIDGRGLVQAISNWLSVSPRERTVRAIWEAIPQRTPTEPVQATAADRLIGLFAKAGLTATSAVDLYRMLAQQSLKTLGVEAAKGLALPYAGVPRALGGRVSPKRSFAFTTLPIHEMKALGKAHGATVNDVLLTTLDIALARYLADQGRRPTRPLVTAMPVALAAASGGNQIAVMHFPLGAPGLSPVERLAAVRAQTATVKGVVETSGSEAVMLYTALVHGLPALVERAGLKTGLPVSNLAVSNPFGFPGKRYLMGAKVDMVLPVSVVSAGQSLNVTAVSLDDRMQLGFLAMPEAVPAIDKLARYTSEAFGQFKRSLPAAEAIAA
ncbi:wax ester/triacylglycerol synthase family O-acyltransferase [Variovorax sp. J22R133]|uniref:wax ester/triacylglycerol synthase domain-containing protein n=1 Tax=Variovorax brevis TaxID=3053503 RepID=UPI0025762CAD|nr:wax ester/triacylglycerol synthase domain-containing protein [Variovorax sp. J22R133]MDM0113692.1 wax ester/triacylglycerol synthase family O-acyltransferase [Variovorax sp. J22R133]